MGHQGATMFVDTSEQVFGAVHTLALYRSVGMLCIDGKQTTHKHMQ